MVKLYLPRLVGEGRFDAEAEATVAATNGGSGELILVVEDDDAVRAYSTETLRELGYRVLAAPERLRRGWSCWRAIPPSVCCSPMSGCPAA